MSKRPSLAEAMKGKKPDVAIEIEPADDEGEDSFADAAGAMFDALKNEDEAAFADALRTALDLHKGGAKPDTDEEEEG